METPQVYNFDGNGGYGYGGWGGIVPGFIGGLVGGALFGNGFGGFGGGGNGAAAAALGAQATANNNADLIMNAVGNVGTQVAGINSTLGNIAISSATNPLQVTNAIQAADARSSQQMSQCCCENRLATCEQTNTIVSAIKDQTVAMNEQFCALQQRELQAEINAKNEVIAQLRAQAQTNTIQGSIALLQQQIAALAARIPVTATTSTSNG
jgi:hypothetical protein